MCVFFRVFVRFVHQHHPLRTRLAQAALRQSALCVGRGAFTLGARSLRGRTETAAGLDASGRQMQAITNSHAPATSSDALFYSDDRDDRGGSMRRVDAFGFRGIPQVGIRRRNICSNPTRWVVQVLWVAELRRKH